jgi:hypothetical protein
MSFAGLGSASALKQVQDDTLLNFLVSLNNKKNYYTINADGHKSAMTQPAQLGFLAWQTALP